MIPVSLPGGNFYVTMGLSLVCLATLLTWGASLARSRDARYWLADHRRLGGTLLALLAIVGGIFPYQQFSHWFEAQRVARAEAARRQVLDHSQELAGVSMPAGTELILRTPGQPDSFEEARFTLPTEVGGAKVLRIVRHLDADGQSKEWSMALAANEPVDGWICGKGHLAEFRVEQGKPRLDSCHLASGNTLDQQALPAGTWLKATPEGWLLRTDGSDALRLEGLDLLKADVQLSPARQRQAFEGLLAHESARGEVTYPAGTRVATPGSKVGNAQTGDLLFSPSRGRSAKRASGEEVAAGKSILQAADGSVRSVLSNRDAGVLDVASVRLGR